MLNYYQFLVSEWEEKIENENQKLIEIMHVNNLI